MKDGYFFNKVNKSVIAGGIFLIALGLFLLSRGPADNPLSITVAPLVLSFAFFIVIPVGIMINKGDSEKNDKEGA
ncbi:MAG: hypothetical protein ACLFQK_06370 [Fibrobacterota bacterium]